MIFPENIVTREINAFLTLNREEEPWRKHSWILHRLVIKLNRHFLASMRLLSPSCRKSIVKLRHLPFSSTGGDLCFLLLHTSCAHRVDACIIIFHINSSIGKINKIARRRQLQIMVIEEYWIVVDDPFIGCAPASGVSALRLTPVITLVEQIPIIEPARNIFS